MDALEFARVRKRMCITYQDLRCEGCPLSHGIGQCVLGNASAEQDDQKTIEIAQQWAEQYLLKTRASEFIKAFPNVPITSDGSPALSPCKIDRDYDSKCVCKEGSYCETCRQKYWNELVK